MVFAIMAYISKDYYQAERLISEISTKAPCASDTHGALGVSHESRGKQDPALGFSRKQHSASELMESRGSGAEPYGKKMEIPQIQSYSFRGACKVQNPV